MSAVVCLHGLGRTPADWDDARAGLARAAGGGAVHAPQLPRERDAALATARAAVVAAGPAIVVGHSMGAVLALRLAASGAHELRALVLTNGFFPPARNGRTTLATAADYAAHRVAFVRAAAAAGGRPRSPASSGLGALAGLALRRDAWRALTAAITAPVLVLHTPDDHHVPIAFARAAAAANGWPLHELPAGGHHAHVARPSEWLAAVTPWLDVVTRG